MNHHIRTLHEVSLVLVPLHKFTYLLCYSMASCSHFVKSVNRFIHSLPYFLSLTLTHSISLSLSLTHTHTHTQVSYIFFARSEVRTSLVGCYVVLTGNYLQVDTV
jgi:hypothetical protein